MAANIFHCNASFLKLPLHTGFNFFDHRRPETPFSTSVFQLCTGNSGLIHSYSHSFPEKASFVLPKTILALRYSRFWVGGKL